MTTAPAAEQLGAVTIPQYSKKRILAYWALATVPMGLGAWVVAPMLAARWDDGLGLLRGLLIALTLGLAWQAVIVAVSVHREQGSLRWPVVRDALWLNAPTNPKSMRSSRRVWWMLIPAAFILAATTAIPGLPEPEARSFTLVLESDSGQEFFAGNWGWFSLAVVMFVLNTFVGEELLFRGLLLPRMQDALGRGGWAANTVLFTAYHAHQPWTMPSVMLSSVVFAYTTQRYRSAWFGIILHSLESVVITALLLTLVLK